MTFKTSKRIGLFAVHFIMILWAAVLLAQDKSGQSGTNYSISFTPMYQFKSDLKDDTDFSAERYFIDLNTYTTVNRTLAWGASCNYSFQRYDFYDGFVFSTVDPWEQIHTINLALSLFYNFRQNWRFMFSPSIQFAGESDADWNEAMSYGGVLTAMHVFNPNLTVGAGAAVYSRLEEVSLFPFIAVSWQFNKHWRLANPLSAGPVGPAGLELSFIPNDQWEFAVGGAYRTFRFRLDEEGNTPNGIGESQILPIFTRVSRKFGGRFVFDFYGGMLFEGRLVLENEKGTHISSERYDPAPFLGLTLTANF